MPKRSPGYMLLVFENAVFQCSRHAQHRRDCWVEGNPPPAAEAAERSLLQRLSAARNNALAAACHLGESREFAAQILDEIVDRCRELLDWDRGLRTLTTAALHRFRSLEGALGRSPAWGALGDLKTLATLQHHPVGPEDVPQYVTLDQMASILNRSKKTLERLKTRQENPLPRPSVEGGGGKADEWIWSEVRPWLAQEFGRPLPERFPSRLPGR